MNAIQYIQLILLSITLLIAAGCDNQKSFTTPDIKKVSVLSVQSAKNLVFVKDTLLKYPDWSVLESPYSVDFYQNKPLLISFLNDGEILSAQMEQSIDNKNSVDFIVDTIPALVTKNYTVYDLSFLAVESVAEKGVVRDRKRLYKLKPIFNCDTLKNSILYRDRLMCKKTTSGSIDPISYSLSISILSDTDTIQITKAFDVTVKLNAKWN